MTSRTRSGLAVATLAAFGCTPFCAEGAGFYLEAGAGFTSFSGFSQSEFDDLMVAVGEDTFNSFTLNDSSLDKSDTGFSVAVGYMFSPNFGVEAAYLQLGQARYEADVTVDDGGGPIDLTMGFGFKSSGPALSLVGMWPVGEKLCLDARAGAYFAKSKAKVFATDGVNSDSDSMNVEDKTGILVGVGATWELTEKLGLRVGYTRIDKAVAGEGDAGTFSAGVRLSF